MVRRCINRDTGSEHAVKFVRCRRHHRQDVYREVTILNLLEHPNIIGLVDVVDGEDDVAVVTDIVEGGELFERFLT